MLGTKNGCNLQQGKNFSCKVIILKILLLYHLVPNRILLCSKQILKTCSWPWFTLQMLIISSPMEDFEEDVYPHSRIDLLIEWSFALSNILPVSSTYYTFCFQTKDQSLIFLNNVLWLIRHHFYRLPVNLNTENMIWLESIHPFRDTLKKCLPQRFLLSGRGSWNFIFLVWWKYQFLLVLL